MLCEQYISCKKKRTTVKSRALKFYSLIELTAADLAEAALFLLIAAMLAGVELWSLRVLIRVLLIIALLTVLVILSVLTILVILVLIGVILILVLIILIRILVLAEPVVRVVRIFLIVYQNKRDDKTDKPQQPCQQEVRYE